ncbi:MAG: hypothetical protein LOY03_06490 [Cyclobacteriaceae bacterium]|jgi:uncharacterized phage infection (PIP) family protein YhgE|nr:hypothetical protein [Cyclobacteriaceae bacterium]
MKKVSKKYVRTKIEEAVNKTIEDLELSPASRKTRKLITKASKKISGQLRAELKKLNKKADKIAKSLAKKEKKARKQGEETASLEPTLN